MKKGEKNKFIILFSYLFVFFIGYGMISQSFSMTVHDPISLEEMVRQSAQFADQYSKQIEQWRIQIEQYNKQIEQLNLQVKNSNSLKDYTWSDTNRTITELLDSIDTISQYQNDMEEYLSQYQDLEYYQSSPCFSSSGCSEEEMDDIQNNKITSSSSQKEANDAMIHGLVLQQSNLEKDAQQLASLQSNATDAEGHMAAIQYANQLASSQANQLMHIRGLLIAQQTAAAARAQEIADKKAQQEAASLQLREGEYQDSPERNWLGVMP